MDRCFGDPSKLSAPAPLGPMHWNGSNAHSLRAHCEGGTSGETLIESAVQAVEEAMATLFQQSWEVPFFRPTDLDALPEDEQVSVQHAEIEQYRMRPEMSAVHFCLTSVTALLEITQTLITTPLSPSPQELERDWKRLAEDAKVAGRAAYRAVLILSDPARAGAGASPKVVARGPSIDPGSP